MRKSKLRFWGFLAPSLIAFCIVVIIPTCIGFFYSLTNWNGIVGSDVKFVGFQNFIDIFTRDESMFMQMMWKEMRGTVPDLGCKSTAAQPPGPGFPEQEPSVNIITSLSVGVILDMGESDFCIIDFLKWLCSGVVSDTEI